MNRQNIGYHCENVWIGFVTLPQAQYPDQNARQHFAQQTLAALRAVPGLESATISADIPSWPAQAAMHSMRGPMARFCRSTSAPRRPAMTLRRIISRPGAFPFWPDVISTSTIPPANQTSCLSAREAQRRFSGARIPSARRFYIVARAYRRKLSVWSVMCARAR